MTPVNLEDAAIRGACGRRLGLAATGAVLTVALLATGASAQTAEPPAVEAPLTTRQLYALPSLLPPEDHPHYQHAHEVLRTEKTSAPLPDTSILAAARENAARELDVPLTGNPEIDSIRVLIAHHRGAIALGMAAMQVSQDEVVRRLANDTVVDHEVELQYLSALLKERTAP